MKDRWIKRWVMDRQRIKIEGLTETNNGQMDKFDRGMDSQIHHKKMKG